MEVKKGAVVISKAGHDKGDGKYRPLERPKKKKLMHLKVTNTVLEEELIKTNKSIRGALKPFSKS